jgi:hypothetical protein
MFGDKPSIFRPGSKPEISLTINRIAEWQDLGHSLRASHYVNGEIEGGHEALISGTADEFWTSGNKVPGVRRRLHVKISSDLSRRQMERGILGGGEVFEAYIDVELNLEPSQVKDVVYELRASGSRQVYVAGYSISPRIFRVTRFGLSGPCTY